MAKITIVWVIQCALVSSTLLPSLKSEDQKGYEIWTIICLGKVHFDLEFWPSTLGQDHSQICHQMSIKLSYYQTKLEVDQLNSFQVMWNTISPQEHIEHQTPPTGV